jgi:uncharacterized membrane protein YuzA (DUF378 family)
MTKRSIRRATTLDRFATGLTGIGALNWGLVGLFNFNLVSTLFGKSLLARIVYTLVGLSGVYLLLTPLQES